MGRGRTRGSARQSTEPQLSCSPSSTPHLRSHRRAAWPGAAAAVPRCRRMRRRWTARPAAEGQGQRGDAWPQALVHTRWHAAACRQLVRPCTAAPTCRSCAQVAPMLPSAVLCASKSPCSLPTAAARAACLPSTASSLCLRMDGGSGHRSRPAMNQGRDVRQHVEAEGCERVCAAPHSTHACWRGRPAGTHVRAPTAARSSAWLPLLPNWPTSCCATTPIVCASQPGGRLEWESRPGGQHPHAAPTCSRCSMINDPFGLPAASQLTCHPPGPPWRAQARAAGG